MTKENSGDFENALGNEYAFRLQVLTSLAEVKKEVSIFNTNTEKQVTELFSQVRKIREEGCGLADTHKDHETRLRCVEREIVTAPRALPPAASAATEGGTGARTKFSIGRWVKWEGFTSTDIIVILAVIVFGTIVILNRVDAGKLKAIESTVIKLSAMRTERSE